MGTLGIVYPKLSLSHYFYGQINVYVSILVIEVFFGNVHVSEVPFSFWYMFSRCKHNSSLKFSKEKQKTLS